MSPQTPNRKRIQDALHAERALLVAVRDTRDRRELFEARTEELRRLAQTAGLDIAELITVTLRATNSATLVGKGKVEEIADRARFWDVSVVIFSRELAPVHQRNLERGLECRVVDRTELILDIFAQHAVTREGKIQVELAQLRYLKPRLTGRGVKVSRLGGGIGTRGPGETQLEVDRRRLDRRIHQLTKEWEKCRKVGQTQRRNRHRSDIISAAMVGYTNAGKSTLLNRLTKSDIPAQDQLFCTLDTTTRRLFLADGPKILVSDTVGFIEDLPKPLLAAFRATLAVVEEADVLVHVMDVSSEEADRQVDAVMSVLKDLNATGKPMLTILNKQDLVESGAVLNRMKHLCEPALPFSATADTDTGPLLEALKVLAAQVQEAPLATAG